MDGEKFQNDESGGLFYHSLLAILYELLVPVTYYFWPRKDDLEKPKEECRGDPCQIKKYNKTRQNIKNNIVKIILIGGWLILLFSSYKLSLINYDLDDDFDPFDILQVSPSATKAEIKKSYHDESKINNHLYKEIGVNDKIILYTIMLLNKDVRENWDKYGNPAGLRAIKLGIGLPSWIVKNEKISILVLGAYALIYMIILPTVTVFRIRWYEHSDNDVLLKTTQLYTHFCSREHFIPLKGIIMILSSSYEFHKDYSNEMQDRESDNIEILQLNKKIPNLGEIEKKRPFCYPYAIKARKLILAHLSRMLLPAETLHKDRMYIVGKCPSLLQEMINVAAYFHIRRHYYKAYEYNFRKQQETKDSLPIIEIVENMMKLCPMIVQGLWHFQSPFLQLPHIKEENIKWFSSKKRNIDSLQQLAKLDSKDRRAVLKGLNNEQYADVMKVLERMPYIELQVTTEVIYDKEIRAEIVKVSLTLERKNIGVLFRDQHKPDKKYDDHDWGNFLRNILGKEKVTAISTKSHSVHCPYFPDDKPEYWWVYVCDKTNKKLKTVPYHITNLVEMEKVQLQFLAPSKPGVYTFTVCLRSDSYLGFDQMHDITLDVKEARYDTGDHPRWNFEVEEEELDSDNSDETGFINDDDID